MKKYIAITLLLIHLGCDTEGWDCIKTSGDIIEEEIVVPAFTEITVFHRVQLFIQQGSEQKVVLETGENLRKNIKVSVQDNRLILENDASCNLFRDYEITKVFVTTPYLTTIRNSSGSTVKSIGTLHFPELTLRSEDTSSDTVTHTNGSYELQLDVDNFTIVSNGIANFFISGSATDANIGLYSGDSRFEGASFVVQDLNFFHRSSNKMIVNPQQSLKGEIRSTGDVISVNQPPVVEVETFYTGQLIFE